LRQHQRRCTHFGTLAEGADAVLLAAVVGGGNWFNNSFALVEEADRHNAFRPPAISGWRTIVDNGVAQAFSVHNLTLRSSAARAAIMPLVL
jgi:hypothetical protein